MPPKKKKGAKNSAKTPFIKTNSLGVDMEAASIEELNQKISALEKEKNKEEEFRNYIQLERDKISAFWEITKTELEDKRAELRNKDREIEELAERQQVEIKVYKQKVKHLLYEHQNNSAAAKSEAVSEFERREKDFQEEQRQLQGDIQTLAQQFHEQELANQIFLKQLKQDHAKEITKLRQAFEVQFNQLKDVSDKKTKKIREASELRRKTEIHEIEERKNAHINDLMDNHERAFFEIKTYYNDITHNNLDLIKTLKEDVAEMKKKEVQNEKLMYEISQENKRLADPLVAARIEVEKLQHQLTSYEENKRHLLVAETKTTALQKDLKNVEWEKELLRQRLDKVMKAQDEAEKHHEATMFKIQQEASLRERSLNNTIQSLSNDLEKKDAQIAEIMIASNLDGATFTQINTKLDEILEAKNATIRSLQKAVARTTKTHNDAIRVFKSKLREADVADEDFGFNPLPCSLASEQNLQ